MSSELAQALWLIFGEGSIHYARAYYEQNSVSYNPIDEALTVPEIIKHLNAEQTLGAYQLLQDSSVRWIAWDVDSPDEAIARGHARKILDVLGDISHCVSWSGGKGYHIFIFLDNPIPASRAKIFGETIRAIADVPKSGEHHVEVFPKQAILTSSNPYGNLLKMPLGQHPRTHNISMFVDPENGWETGGPVPPLEVLNTRIRFDELQRLIRPMDPLEAIRRLIVPIWIAGDRHTLALALSGFLGTAGWGFEDSKELIEKIATDAGDEEVHNRVGCVMDTFRALANGQPIAGMSALRDLLPGGILQQVVDLVNQIATPDTVREIDGIRLQRNTPIFLKVRTAVQNIWSHLVEQGVPLQTKNEKKYWYRREDHSVIDLDSIDWEAYLADWFGFNMRDTFGSQVGRELMLQFHRDANVVDVHKRSVWTGEKLYVHLDGPHVYVLDGYKLDVQYNGECGYMFYNLGRSPVEIIPDSPPAKVDVWEELVNDISFSDDSSDTAASAKGQKELFKLWILAFFFPQLLHVRPMLCVLGTPGSGKTSAVRRVLRVLESPDQDVLGLVIDKPDAFRSTLARHKMIVLDNLEKTRAKWLVDTLNRILTGSEIELRKLYATNEVVRIIPDAFIATTAVSLPFDEETLYSRILPIELSHIEKPMAEHLLQKRLIDNRVAIWYSLLGELSYAVRSLLLNPNPPTKYAGRLADFVLLSQRLCQVPSIDYPEVEKAIDALQSHQKTLLREASAFIQALEIWIKSNPEQAAKEHTIAELWQWLQPIARASGIQWTWKAPRSLAPHVRAMEDSLRKYYGMQQSTDQTTFGKRDQKNTYSFHFV